jgi:hypothetical protein
MPVCGDCSLMGYYGRSDSMPPKPSLLHSEKRTSLVRGQVLRIIPPGRERLMPVCEQCDYGRGEWPPSHEFRVRSWEGTQIRYICADRPACKRRQKAQKKRAKEQGQMKLTEVRA